MAMGLPIYHGAQLAGDTTLVSALRRDGSLRPGATDVDGVALVAARRRKERTYPELHADGGRARLVVAALEVGGRWSSEAWTFVRLLARARAQQEPDLVRASAALAWHRRFVSIIAVAAQRALADSLLDHWVGPSSAGDAPSTVAVLEDARYVLR